MKLNSTFSVAVADRISNGASVHDALLSVIGGLLVSQEKLGREKQVQNAEAPQC